VATFELRIKSKRSQSKRKNGILAVEQPKFKGGNLVKIENWKSHQIRFILIKGEWWAIGKDVTDILGYVNSNKTINDHLESDEKLLLNAKTQYQSGIKFSYKKLGQRGGYLINEAGIYELILSSRQPEAKEFRKWVKKLIKELRQSVGLEGYEIFKLTDAKHQSQAMDLIKKCMCEPSKIDYIKANSITNKAVANMYGLSKAIGKDNMTPSMLLDRQTVLDATIKLMIAKDVLGEHGEVKGFSVKEAIYEQFGYGTALQGKHTA